MYVHSHGCRVGILTLPSGLNLIFGIIKITKSLNLTGSTKKASLPVM